MGFCVSLLHSIVRTPQLHKASNPHVIFARNSPNVLSTSAKNCTSLNLSLTVCLGPKDRMSSRNFGNSSPSIITTYITMGATLQWSILSLWQFIKFSIKSILNHFGVIPYFTPNAANNGWHLFWSHHLPKFTVLCFKFFAEHFKPFFRTVYFLF